MAKMFELRDQILRSFDENDLRLLCFDLNIQYEDLPGNTRSTKAQELVAYHHRINNMPELINVCAQRRPRTKWQRFADIEPLTLIDVTSPESTTLSPQQVRLFLELLGIPDSLNRNKYADAQLDVYSSIWKALHSLKIAGDDLWETVSRENILNFSHIWDEVEQHIEENAIFLEDADYRELKRLLKLFSQYRLGKFKLFEIREYNERMVNRLLSEEMAREQIQQNRAHKEQYETVLESVKSSFRTRLSQT